MRRSLYFEGPRQVKVHYEDIPSPGPGTMLIKSDISAISAGTEMLFYRSQLEAGSALDPTIGSLGGSFSYPFKYGYSTVGKVVSAGDPHLESMIGRTVFSFHPHESYFLARPEDIIEVPSEIREEDAVFLPSMETAVSLVMDARPILGERAVIIGQGVIGLLTTAIMAKMPLSHLTTIDRFQCRKEASLELGASKCISADASLDEMTRSLPDDSADLVLELSGDPRALELAMRSVGYEGRIVVGSWYGNKRQPICFGEKFHRGRLRIISSQVSNLSPELSGRWSKDRRLKLAWKMISEICPSRLITHRFSIDDAEHAYQKLDEDAGSTIQVVIRYEGD